MTPYEKNPIHLFSESRINEYRLRMQDSEYLNCAIQKIALIITDRLIKEEKKEIFTDEKIPQQ